MSKIPVDEYIIGFYGKRGSGKTLNATKRGIILAEITNRPLYANYHINYKNFHYFEDFRDIEELTNAIIIYDEIHVDLDSRYWDKKNQTRFTHWITQIRKMYCTFLYTTQRLNTLEKRIRENSDYVYICKKNLNKNEFYEYLCDIGEGIDNMILLNKTTTYNPYLLYHFYDTGEIIKHKNID